MTPSREAILATPGSVAVAICSSSSYQRAVYWRKPIRTPPRSTIAGACASAMLRPPPVWMMPCSSSTRIVSRMFFRS